MVVTEKKSEDYQKFSWIDFSVDNAFNRCNISMIRPVKLLLFRV